MSDYNPGPASTGTPNQSSQLSAPFNPIYTYATLPSGVGTLPGSLQYTSDLGLVVWSGTAWISTGAASANIQNATLQSPGNLIIVGDSMSSITVANGASSVANMWANKFATALGLTAQHGGHGNYIVGQYWTSDAGDVLFDQIITPTTLSAGLWGYNNLFTNGPNSATPLGAYYLSDYAVDVYAIASWLCVPNSQKVLMILPGTGGATPNPAVTRSGTWTTLDNVPTGIHGQYAGGGSSGTATFTVTGDTIRVWFSRFGPANNQASVIYNVVVDGVTTTQFSCQCQSTLYQTIPVSIGANNYSVSCSVLGGFANTTHTVTITVSGTSGQNGILYGVSGSVSTQYLGPVTLLGGCMRGSAAGYANNGNTIINPVASGITAPEVAVMGDSAVIAQNVIIGRVAARLQAEGLSAIYVDPNIDYDIPTQQYTGDNVHPNNYGHQMIALKMLQAMKLRSLII